MGQGASVRRRFARKSDGVVDDGHSVTTPTSPGHHVTSRSPPPPASATCVSDSTVTASTSATTAVSATTGPGPAFNKPRMKALVRSETAETEMLKNAARSLGSAWTETELKSLLAVWRALTDGRMEATLEQFSLRFSCVYGLSTQTKANCFNFFDTTGRGLVSFQEFVEGMTQCQRGSEATATEFVFRMYADLPGGRMSRDAATELVRDAAGCVTSRALATELEAAAAERAKLTDSIPVPIVHLTDDPDVSNSQDAQHRRLASTLFEPRPARTPSPGRPPALQVTGSAMGDTSMAETADLDRFREWCDSGHFDHDAYLNRFDLVPLAATERAVIDTLIAGHTMRPGQTWCAMSFRWWEAWSDYCGFEDRNSIVSVSRKGSVAVHARRRTQRMSLVLDPGRVVVEKGVFAGAQVQAGRLGRQSRMSVSSGAASPMLMSRAVIKGMDRSRPLTPFSYTGGADSTPTPTPVASNTPSSFRAVGESKCPDMMDDGASPTPVPTPFPVAPTPGVPSGSSNKRLLLTQRSMMAVAPLRPGPIHNTDLQGESPDVIRADAEEHVDYVLVPEAAWVQFMCWYGGGPSYPRRVVDHSGGQPDFNSLLSPHGTRMLPRATSPTAPPPATADSVFEVELWPRPLRVAFKNATREGMDSALAVDIRTGSQQSWASVMAHSLTVLDALQRRFALSPADPQLPTLNPIAVARQSMESLRVLDLDAYRLHVKVDAYGAEVCYQLDTTDSLDVVENSILSGGETLVLERQLPTGGWAMPSIKGDRLWMQIEVGDWLDARHPGGEWLPAVVDAVEPTGTSVTIKFRDGSTAQVRRTTCSGSDAELAPYMTRSTSEDAVPRQVTAPSSVRRSGSSKASNVDPSMVESKAGGDGDCKEDDTDTAAADGRHAHTRRRQTSSRFARFRRSTNKTGGAGMTGLLNLGNTCFMNSIVQCLSHTESLAGYFLSNAYAKHVNKSNPLGTGGKLAEEFARLLADLWSTKRGATNPIKFKVAISQFAPRFSGFNQHDSQEFLAFLLDGLHEDVNRVTNKPYVEVPDAGDRPDEVVAAESWELHCKRNVSALVDMFQGQLKSTLECLQPGCGKRSVTFDPFMYLSLSLPVRTHRDVAVAFVPLPPPSPAPPVLSSATATATATAAVHNFQMKVPRRAKMFDVLDAVGKAAGLSPEQLLAADVYQHKVYKAFATGKRLSSIRDTDTLVVYQVDPKAQLMLEVWMGYTSRAGKLTPWGVPVILSTKIRVTGAQLWDSVSALTATAVPGASSPSSPSSTFTLRLQSRSFGACGVCEASTGCPGCPVPRSDRTVVTLSEDSTLLVEWPRSTAKAAMADTVTLPEFGALEHGRTLPLASLLNTFVAEETLGDSESWFCSDCQTHRQATKHMALWAAPEVLVLHLKRFQFTARHRAKISAAVDFPLVGLDLADWVATSDLPSSEPVPATSRRPKQLLYDLFAVSMHTGGLGAGHYTAVAQNAQDGQWYRFDDDVVDRVDPADAIDPSSAYVLFYKRRRGTPTSL